MQATRRLLLLLVASSFAASWLFSVAQGSPLQFVPVTPCRVVDTRNPDGTFGGPAIQGGTYRSFPIPQGACNIPASAAAYSLNVTVVPQTTLGYLTIWPTGEGQPLVSTMNSPDGRIKANAAIVAAGMSSGSVSVYVTDTTNVILDIDGYFSPPASGTYQFYPLAPCRIVDTRGGQDGGTLQAGVERDYAIPPNCGVPSNAVAYSFNVTVLPAAGGLDYLTVWPQGELQPLVSTLNDDTGTIVANAAVVPAGSNNKTAFYPHNNDTDLLLDIDGYFATPGTGGLLLYPSVPCRVLDTRNGQGAFNGVLSPPVDVVNSPCFVPSTVQAYVLNATVVPPGPMLYLTLWPDGEQQPVVSTLNAEDGFITSNMAIVPTIDGDIDAYAAALTQLIVDISGYFAPVNALPVDGAPPLVIIWPQPQDEMVIAPASATFSVTAIGSPPIAYQWNKNGTPISGAAGASYTTPPTTSADNGANFTVTVTNSVNGFTSSPATLTVVSAPVAPAISVQPVNVSVSQGNTASFYVIATGTALLSYQWNKNGTPISGATGFTYTTPPTTSADNGSQFTVTVTNTAGLVTSIAAALTVVSTVNGLGGIFPLFPGSPTDLIGVRYRFQVVANTDQHGKIIFGSSASYTPGSNISYDIESDVYSWLLTFTNGGCTTYPPLGTDTYAQASLHTAAPDYPYGLGEQPALGSGINTSDPVNWPIQTYLIDDMPNFYKSDSVSQFNFNGIEARVTIERGNTLTDISGFERCGLPMLSGTYRMWTATTEITGYPTVVHQVVLFDADAQYLFPYAYTMTFYSEFLSSPGTFTVQYWDFAYMRESEQVWAPVSTLMTNWNYDGDGQDFGVHVVSVNGQDRVEFSNVPGNSYLPGNLPFSIAPP